MTAFDQKIDRNGTASMKWDRTEEIFNTKETILPMWVADMDFQPPQAVLDTMQQRLNHGIFGYTYTGTSVTEAIQTWMEKHYNWQFKSSEILYSPGVVPSISKCIQTLTNPGEKVLIQSPVYPPFFSMTTENERKIENRPLKEVNGTYTVDLADFEAAVSRDDVTMFLLCSPHNPVGRVWNEDELRGMAELCVKHNVIIVSDEIHADLTLPGYKHLPTATLSEDIDKQTITLSAPSKTFNLAGLQASFIITSNREWLEALQAFDKKNNVNMLNTFGVLAMEAAYKHGEEWLDELREYIAGNVELVYEFFRRELTPLKVKKVEATYLVWIDCRALNLDDKELNRLFIEEGQVGFNPGHSFGSGGEGFVRMNVACPRSTVQEGLERIKTAVTPLLEKTNA
ncbi:MalY/PatB family protein [Salisediminibacterium halotolerans]|uniref:MalY/PatB family protein n=1 Tax=Salisediminibacterium halotolerans TaxID=517425 RepID=UPI000EB15F20|nr:PatB family C-S lyase [Salisediminibacterium halotolerans]RLJ73226.1 cystathionine beta-lyase [Actinophytocola xinjiangensis]RPE86648.1 cystathionine beta-lyase [Salisediminibacterium halotolerans]TWG34023.1 cystathionine beta-lyase [Salisediminibacterium halotolerans]GEL09077.1 cystathionine beta-lyase PatB [Salisediminibacterium halotolerans]